MSITRDKIIAVQVTANRINYKTHECPKPTSMWTGYVCVDNANIMVEHLMTIARKEGRATTERKLIDRIFHGQSLGLYNIGEFQFTIQGL